MRFKLLFFLSLIILLSCTKKKEISKWVKSQCARKVFACKENCVSGKFRYCYKDSTDSFEKKGWRDGCWGIHVGNVCNPCEEIFALNFGGAMRKVDCHEFFSHVEERNKKCKFCIQAFGGPIEQ
jgi:hypothetical protein